MLNGNSQALTHISKAVFTIVYISIADGPFRINNNFIELKAYIYTDTYIKRRRMRTTARESYKIKKKQNSII